MAAPEKDVLRLNDIKDRHTHRLERLKEFGSFDLAPLNTSEMSWLIAEVETLLERIDTAIQGLEGSDDREETIKKLWPR